MDRISNNEKFLRHLITLCKKDAVLKLRSASDEECKSLVELILNAESYLDSKLLKKYKGEAICTSLKKLKNISRKVLVKLFAKSFEQVITLIAMMLLTMFEQSISNVYGINDV
jgi:hypothetical protein